MIQSPREHVAACVACSVKSQLTTEGLPGDGAVVGVAVPAAAKVDNDHFLVLRCLPLKKLLDNDTDGVHPDEVPAVDQG